LPNGTADLTVGVGIWTLGWRRGDWLGIGLMMQSDMALGGNLGLVYFWSADGLAVTMGFYLLHVDVLGR
jgi:hypothetical protein